MTAAQAVQLLHCLSIFVMVFLPPISLAENETLSPACTLSSRPGAALNCCSVAPPPLAPTVSFCACRGAVHPLIFNRWL